MTLLALTGLSAAGQSDGDGGPRFSFPTEADHLLIDIRESSTGGYCEEEVSRCRTWRVFGDGRMEIVPAPSWLRGERSTLDPVAVEQLLRTLDDSLGLAVHQTTQPAPETGSYVAVHLRHYASADWAVDYLDAVVTHDLEIVFRELTVLKTWLALRDPPGPVFVSLNPSPEICEAEYRLRQGLAVLEPAWCVWFHERFQGKVGPFFRGGDADVREAVRERLRERLRSLPRGLAEGDDEPEESCADQEARGVDLKPVG